MSQIPWESHILFLITFLIFSDFSRKLARTDDYSQLLIWLPKFILDQMFLWPERPKTYTKLAMFIFFFLIMVVIFFGCITYIKNNTFVDGVIGILALSNISQVSISGTFFYVNVAVLR